MDLDSFVTELYVIVDDWWRKQPEAQRREPGRPAELTVPEVITLAVLAQWPRWRAERDFWRWARRHLGRAFPALGSQSQFNRAVRSSAPWLRRLQGDLAAQLAALVNYHVLDTTLVPVMRRVRAGRRRLFAGEAAFGRSASHTDWVYGFKVALCVTDAGVITAFGLAPANVDERPVGEALIAATRQATYLADKGFASWAWEQHCRATYGAEVIATPTRRAHRAWPEAACRWASGRRQIIEQVIGQLKDLFALERHRAKTVVGLLARLAAKVLAYTLGQLINLRHGRPLRQLADLLL